jgi:hypothetical protein
LLATSRKHLFSNLPPPAETKSQPQVEEEKLATLVTTAHTERMVLRCHAEWVQTISDLHKGDIPETFYVTQNLLKSELT